MEKQPKGSVGTGPVRQAAARLQLGSHAPTVGGGGGEKRSRVLTFFLSDFTELPIAYGQKISLCVLFECANVAVAARMHVCLHVFPGVHGNRSD